LCAIQNLTQSIFTASLGFWYHPKLFRNKLHSLQTAR